MDQTSNTAVQAEITDIFRIAGRGVVLICRAPSNQRLAWSQTRHLHTTSRPIPISCHGHSACGGLSPGDPERDPSILIGHEIALTFKIGDLFRAY